MAGSRVNRTYTSDTDEEYTVNIDESNAESMAYGAFNSDNAPLPKTLEQRYVLGYFASTPLKKRKLTVGTKEKFSDLIATPSLNIEPYPGVTPETFKITFFSGEKRRVLQGEDTGLNDGDNP